MLFDDLEVGGAAFYDGELVQAGIHMLVAETESDCTYWRLESWFLAEIRISHADFHTFLAPIFAAR